VREIGVSQMPEASEIEVSPPPNLWQRLMEVAAQCSYVQKGGQNLFHKYNYAAAADVLEKVSKALHSEGLVSWTESEIHDWREKTTKSGSLDNLVTVRTRLHIVDPDSGQEVVTVAFGSGQDAGDKAVMKAQTAALKYAWLMTLNISTGDDPEADAKTDERVAGEKRAKPAPRGPKTGDFTAADKELERQAAVDGDEVCGKCLSPLQQYTSKAGKVYRQCQKAHDTWEIARKSGKTGEELKAFTQGHTYKMGAGDVGLVTETVPQEATSDTPAPLLEQPTGEERYRGQPNPKTVLPPERVGSTAPRSTKAKLEEAIRGQDAALDAPPF
jgi:hypothetical protein